MSIKINKPGILATLQDAGRHGYRNIGMGSGGAMDLFAMRVANYLCGNQDECPVMEFNFPAPEILFEEDAMIGIAGADFTAVIDEMTVLPWRTLLVKKNSVLKFRQPAHGSKVYLAVQGGWDAEKWLGSCSTHLKLRIGGHHGRSLQKDDRISFKPCVFSFSANRMLPCHISQNELDRIYKPSNSINCLHGPEYEMLDTRSMKIFTQQSFSITHQSDRMGYRLKGPVLSKKELTEMISSPVDSGVIQLLPDGQCIILMADHQTTGGYPRIASVIKADHPRLAQLMPGQTIDFRFGRIEEAESEFLQMKKLLAEIKIACYLNLKNYVQAGRY